MSSRNKTFFKVKINFQYSSLSEYTCPDDLECGSTYMCKHDEECEHGEKCCDCADGTVCSKVTGNANSDNS